LDLNHFGVPGRAGAYLPVGGVYSCSTGVTGDDIRHPLKVIKNGFQAPETSAGKVAV
jgi:hypothetical protein